MTLTFGVPGMGRPLGITDTTGTAAFRRLSFRVRFRENRTMTTFSSDSKAQDNRRRADRMNLPTGYTPVSVKPVSGGRTLNGHAYDLSVGGVMFELDRCIEPGTAVAVEITLPASLGETQRKVRVVGNVVWLDDSDVGPVRMAVAFTRFEREGDELKLHRVIANHFDRRAA